jgi:23S rRNA (uracil1939-C5)-methyltransferase
MERYRSRIRLHVQGGRLGFYSEKSHQLIGVEDCLVASEQLCRLLKEVRAWLVRQLAHASEVRSLELRALQPESQALPHPRSCSVTIVLASGSVVTAGLRRAAAELDSHAIVHFSGEKATPQRLDESEPHTYAFPGAFSQVNRHVNQHLVARVVQAARSLGAATFLDVYCGNGNFSLPLLSQGLSGVGVDLSKDGIECAEYGARGMADRGRFFAEPAVHFLARSEIKERSFDLAIVDPPRRGAKEVLSHLVQLRLRALIMVSCDPVTCARDLGFLTERGFVLDALAVFDMFPQTHHLEAFVLLRRPS